MIAVVVPTIRYETEYKRFLEVWEPLFASYRVDLITVVDGDLQELVHRRYYEHDTPEQHFAAEYVVPPPYGGLVMKKSPACRNLGFAYVARFVPEAQIIITLDDDVRPHGDTFLGHLMALAQKVPSSNYFNTFLGSELYPRGFPYEGRFDREVTVSHGPWLGVADWDAPSQLVQGNPPVEFFVGPVPKGMGFSVCGMNLAFKRKMLPYVYYAPVALLPGAERFDDIWMGRYLKGYMDAHDQALYTGLGAVEHERASNVYTNLVREAVGIGIHEDYAAHQTEPFFEEYAKMRQLWTGWMNQWL